MSDVRKIELDRAQLLGWQVRQDSLAPSGVVSVKFSETTKIGLIDKVRVEKR